MMGSSLLGVARLAAYAAFTLPLMPVQALLVWLGSPLRHRLPRAYHAVCARLIGLHVEVVGQPSSQAGGRRWSSPTIPHTWISSFWDR